MYAALLHAIEAVILLNSRAADGSIGIHALLQLIPEHRGLASALLASSACAFTVLLRSRSLPVWLTLVLLAPQQSLLLTTAIAAWFAVWHGSYADGVLRSSLFITADQLPRGMFSLIHLTAMYGLVSYSASRSRRSRAAH